MLLALLLVPAAQAATVQHLNTQTATATGAGATGIPTIASFNIPSGKNRALFIWASFERDHCSNADVTGGLCVNGNTAGTGLGDNYPEPRVGTPPATTSNNQLTARVVGPGGTINKQNALVVGGTPSGDTRFIRISTAPTGAPAGTAFFSVDTFHIVLFESEINTLLGGAASGTVTITLPDTSSPTNAGDDAMLSASVFQNVEQTVTGFVRNATATAQVTTGTPGNSSLAPAAYDAGQAPDEADDGKLVTGTNASTEGFLLPAGHVALATMSVTNAAGNYDTPNGNVNNEPNGVTGGIYFRNGGATPGSLYTLQMAGAAATLTYGATNASFLLESDNADVGDAPISYGNPTHTITGIRMGAAVDADASLLNNATATGDDVNNTDDEDGVTLTPLLPIGQTTVVPVSIQNAAGVLNAWFDWNADGDFNDAGEQMVSDQAVAVGTTNLNIAVPVGAVVGPTFARFRVCTSSAATAPLDNCNTPTSTVQSGEVEDYQFQVGRTVTLRKTTVGGAGGPFGYALTNTVQATGTVTTAAASTPTQVDGDTGTAGTQVFTVSSPTTAVTINENSLPAGWSLAGATCVNAASATVGSLTGSTYTITGAEVAASISFTCTFTNNKLPILRLQKAMPNGRAAGSDQVVLTISGTGGPATATTTGGGTTVNNTATLNPGAVGAVYTFSETPSGTMDFNAYTSTYACTNALAGGQTPSGTGTTFNVTAVAGDDLTCTFTNALKPSLTLAKTWSNAIVNDAATVSITPVPAIGAALASVANTANETDTGATPYRVDIGTTYTVSETFTVGTAANYTPNLVCAGNTGAGAAFTYTAGASSGTITIGSTSTAVTCTFTNTRKSTTFRLAKAWGANSIAGNVASIGATTGLTNNTTAFTSTASTNTNGATVTVFAGETATLPAETFTTGTLANYTTTLACDNGVTPSGSNGQASNTVAIPNNVAVLITCTYTNTRKSTTFRLAKAWGANAIAGNVASIGATTGLTNNTTAFTSTASTNTNGATVTVFAGETATLPAETFTTGTLANYTTTLACDNGVTPSGSNGQASNTVAIPNNVAVLITCTYTNNRKSATLTLQKQWNTAVVNDTATVTVSRSATVIDTLNSVANTPTELDTDATPTSVLAGEALTLAETLGGTGAYNSALACTGGGTLAGSTVTVDSSGTAVTCTYTNTRQSADLRLTKTNTPGLNGEVDQAADTVVSGATTSYTITVTNLGPDGANGAVVTDPAPTNLTCSTATCTAAGGATCPVPSGAALVTALQGAGATVPTLPNGGSVTITMTCTVN